jgi:hypothetical protein
MDRLILSELPCLVVSKIDGVMSMDVRSIRRGVLGGLCARLVRAYRLVRHVLALNPP